MSDIDRRVRESLHEHAERTPAASSLLADVHRRSARLGRRRRLTALGAGLAAVLAVAGVAGTVAWPGGGSPSRLAAQPPQDVHDPSAGLSLSPPSAADVPVFPYRPGVTPAGGLAPPVVSVEAGWIVAYYEAKDPVRGADVTVSVGAGRPRFAAPAGPVGESPHRLRGDRTATLRRVSVTPAAQLSLYWQESPTRWVRIDTDDTLTDAELVNFANRLRPDTVPAAAPFRLDLAPAGMPVDTVTTSTMSWRPAGGTGTDADRISCTLIGARPLTGPTTPVGRYRGTLRRTAADTTLTVALDDRGQSLVVRVPARYPVGDADLIRFAAGVHPTEQAASAGD
ncbi:hypothetical protein [Couchioplanes azureus]|uniref:hypothetical protein n=1 Tax=Couchioplanes caeruleus TaxID=56438 RepID=UPI0016703B06|nr:hypothetical protein [Couchioplanes caeruleus]GGQ77214.1 hypothetical protein GCM10010166_53950 [Couchioplanes caeruleus subsp. azureus]